MTTIWFCHHHQAYFANHSTYTETGSGGPIEHTSDYVTFGPFDSSTDVLQWLDSNRAAIETMATLADLARARDTHPSRATPSA